MRQKFSYLAILAYVGFTWSAVATIYLVGQYFAISISEVSVQALKPGRDIMIEKLSTLPSNDKNMTLILKELRSRNEQIIALHTAMTSMNSNSKERVGYGMLFWAGVVVIFAFISAIVKRGEADGK